MRRTALLIVLLFLVPSFAAQIPLKEWCRTNGYSATFQNSFGYLSLSGGGKEVRVFLSMPYVVTAGEIHYMKEKPAYSTNGEILLPAETAALVRSLLAKPLAPVMVTQTVVVTNRANPIEIFYDPSKLAKASNALRPSNTASVVRTSSASQASKRPSAASSSSAKTGGDDGFRPVTSVIIDPGHGGQDPGGIGWNGIQEKEIVLDVSLRLRKELETLGIPSLVLTRKKDVFVTLADRSKITAEESKKKNVIFVSVHGNISLDRNIQGLEVYSLADRASDAEAQSVEFAENSQFSTADIRKAETVLDILSDLYKDEVRRESEVLASSVAREFVAATGCVLRGVKKANFYVLRYSPVPSILTEIGFMSNPSEGKKLMDRDYRKKIARGIALGVASYIREYERTRGFTK